MYILGKYVDFFGSFLDVYVYILSYDVLGKEVEWVWLFCIVVMLFIV